MQRPPLPPRIQKFRSEFLSSGPPSHRKFRKRPNRPVLLAYSDGWKSYDALGIYGYNYKKVKHHENEFADGDNHLNGIESFWSWTKQRLSKLHGFTRNQFVDFLLELEWRFNHRDDTKKQLQIMIKKHKVLGVI
ncbi:MAG TPA: hypothetical protein DEP87_03075 [Candidatus Pacebacteria bacterium]|nr:hypothetical protein [Candidatus Paceibacterota bacterium]